MTAARKQAQRMAHGHYLNTTGKGYDVDGYNVAHRNALAGEIERAITKAVEAERERIVGLLERTAQRKAGTVAELLRHLAGTVRETATAPAPTGRAKP